MAKPTGFLETKRQGASYRPTDARTQDFKQVMLEIPDETLQSQAARCMDCGVPFCSNPNNGRGGCPLGNVIPDWNDLVYRGKWEEAISRLHSTNNFPEFTGSICPAPCEAGCVLSINDDPVTIKNIEFKIVSHAWDNGLIKAVVPEKRSGRSVAVVGSGPAGLAAAQQLCRAGHTVTVFEKSDRIGGLLQYGIPEFKMEKWIIERRLEQMKEEGVSFQTGVHVGSDDLSTADLRRNFDAVLLCMGAEKPRDLSVDGRELEGVHFAMDFLPQATKRVHGDSLPPQDDILATGKHVIVLGGGDTGSDCVGTSHRQGALSVTSIELLEEPPEGFNPNTPWPMWPVIARSSSSHDEGGTRKFAMNTKHFSGAKGRVERLHGVEIRFGDPDESGRPKLEEVPGTEFELEADLVLLALGFLGPVQQGLIEQLGLKLDPRGNVETPQNDFRTSEPGVFAAGDCRRGQSLVVWAQWEGREAATVVDRYLSGASRLQSRGTRGNFPI
jgi:glutamate synthase (NADPH/NADH) small chain